MIINVLKVTPWKDGNLRALAVVQVGPITIHNCRIIQEPGKRAYVAGPQHQVNDRWLPLVTMEAELRKQVQMIVLAQAVRQGIIKSSIDQ